MNTSHSGGEDKGMKRPLSRGNIKSCGHAEERHHPSAFQGRQREVREDFSRRGDVQGPGDLSSKSQVATPKK